MPRDASIVQSASYLLPLTALQACLGLRYVIARGFPGDERRLLTLHRHPGSLGVSHTDKSHYQHDISWRVNLPLGFRGLSTTTTSAIEFPHATYTCHNTKGPNVDVVVNLLFQDCYCGEPAPEWSERASHELVDILGELERQFGLPRSSSDWLQGTTTNVCCVSALFEASNETTWFRRLVAKQLIKQLRTKFRLHFVEVLRSQGEWDHLTVAELQAYEDTAISLKRRLYPKLHVPRGLKDDELNPKYTGTGNRTTLSSAAQPHQHRMSWE
ncbi:hypothetical protein GMRT_13867 [Giardia muris]|uniref:Uncharacterized protein n=1 Tax=Giardia muris TaxID=5742 RepID=A0A4Z1SUS7_GIAMU|nr:hypothetical protein GMRT_13867 [Giardia muris]|eukprot:TNJ27358.1 hypothetical protein GMRT_13867 [Giardia muris]